MNAFLNIAGMFLMAWKSEPPMAAPSVPPKTISMAGMLSKAITLEPSSVAPRAMNRPPATTPISDEAFISAALPRDVLAGRLGRRAAHQREPVDALLGARALRQRRGEHRRAPLVHGGDDL